MKHTTVAALYRIRLQQDARKEGLLTVIPDDGPLGLGISVRRVFTVTDVPAGGVRRDNAHRDCAQVVVCLRGAVQIVIDDGNNAVNIRLSGSEEACSFHRDCGTTSLSKDRIRWWPYFATNHIRNRITSVTVQSTDYQGHRHMKAGMEKGEYGLMDQVEGTLWWYAGLHANVLKAIDKYAGRTNELLDAGCGTGGTLQRIAERYPEIRLHGLDVSEYACEATRTKTGASVVQGSVDALPYKDRSFDALIAWTCWATSLTWMPLLQASIVCCAREGMAS